jgi:hypothetical protein
MPDLRLVFLQSYIRRMLTRSGGVREFDAGQAISFPSASGEELRVSPGGRWRRSAALLSQRRVRREMEAILRKMKIRSRDLLDNAMADALACVTASDISGWFKRDECCLCQVVLL